MQTNPVTIPVTAGQSSTVISGLSICTTYQVVARAATCASEALSEPQTISLVDVTMFDFIVNLNGASTCTDYIKTDNTAAIGALERSMQQALLSTDCGSFSVSCFANSALECSRDNPGVVYFRCVLTPTHSLIYHHSLYYTIPIPIIHTLIPVLYNSYSIHPFSFHHTLYQI